MSTAIGCWLKVHSFDDGGASMTMEFILYSIGFGLPAVLMLSVSAMVGWIVRKEAGALVCSGIVASILNFGATVREGGLDLTQRQTAIAAGASMISTAVIFLLLHAAGRTMREEAATQRNIVLTLGALALITVGAAGSMAGTLFLTGYPMWNDYTASLTVYVALFGGLAAVAQSVVNERKSMAAKVESKAADTMGFRLGRYIAKLFYG